MSTSTDPRGISALYRAVWRWHFYAGLIVLPFVVLIAATGAIYLFKDELNTALQPELRLVEPGGTALAPSRIAAAALEAHPGRLATYVSPETPDRAAEVKIRGRDGMTDTVFVDPYTATVLGSAWDAGPSGSAAMYVVRKLHSLEYVGTWGTWIVEAVAGWMILLVITGIYLWWPRGRGVGVLRPRRTAGRAWWRDIHAVTGIYASVFIVFLALTGLPWSSVWGKWFYDLSHAAGVGMPDGYWSRLPVSQVPTGVALDRSPWALEGQPMPVSGPKTAAGVPMALDAVVANAEASGLHPGYAVRLPSDARDVFTASVYPHDISQERVIHMDQYTGEILVDMGIDDLGALGWAAEWGVAIHMGQPFGLANRIVLALACAAILLMALSAVVIWWKRRPAGRLGAPTAPSDWRIPRTILLVAIAAGLIFPLVGLTLIFVAAAELALHLVRRLRTS